MKGLLLIGLVVLLALLYYSGGVQIEEGRLSINYQNTVEMFSAKYNYVAGEFSKAYQSAAENITISKPPPGYDLQVTEVRNLKDCVQTVIDKMDPCLLVKLEMKNNHSERIDFEIIGKAIVTKDGKQIERYGGLYNTKELNGLCDTDVYYKLFPGARMVTGMCFPLVGKSDEPVLYIKMVANGKFKEHNLDLAQYIS